MVFFGDEFLGQFTGFLITLGVPVAAWCGIMLADIALRRRDYAEPDLYDPAGRYGDVRWFPIAVIAGRAPCSAGAWSPTPPPGWLAWQGYLLGPFGLGGPEGAWAYANLGVLLALVLGFVATLLARAARRCGPRRQAA